MPYSITLAAQGDIEGIVRAIGQDNPRAAEEIEERLYEAFELLAENPDLGHERADLTDRPVLFWSVKRTSYAAIYRKAASIEIVRVIHWSRDLASLLSDEITGR